MEDGSLKLEAIGDFFEGGIKVKNVVEINEDIMQEGRLATVAKWTFDEVGDIQVDEPEDLVLVGEEKILEEIILSCEGCGEDYRRRIAVKENCIITIRQPCQCSIQPDESAEQRKEREKQEILKYFAEQNLIRGDNYLLEMRVFPGQEEAMEMGKVFLHSSHEGKALLLSGGCGRGKSEIALAIGNSADIAGRSVIAIKAVDLQDRIKRNLWNEKERLNLIRKLKAVDLLIIDDLGREKPSEWVQSVLYGIIDYRYGKKDLIFTSNLSRKELSAKLGNELTSRIIASKEVVMEGTDWRLEPRKPSSQGWAEQMGLFNN